VSYARGVDLLLAVGHVFVALTLLTLVQLLRFVLRFLRDAVEMEPGGSFGWQFGGLGERRGRHRSQAAR
jgi:hypothetical protein